MKLTEQEIALFYKLWYRLVWGINEKHRVIQKFKKPVYGTRLTVSMEAFVIIRDQIWEHPQWIDEFLADTENYEFTELERGIIVLWRKHFVKGKFLVFKHLQKHSVLMRFDKQPNMLYGVCGISDPIKVAFPQSLPFLVNMVLLPFMGKVIYDGIASEYNIAFGPGLRSDAKEWFAESQKMYGIVEMLNGELNIPIVQDPSTGKIEQNRCCK